MMVFIVCHHGYPISAWDDYKEAEREIERLIEAGFGVNDDFYVNDIKMNRSIDP